MINQLRTEACSGGMDDLAHVVSVDCLADCLTKNSAKPDYLIKAVDTGLLPNCDKNPPFREMMKGRHKAYQLADWLVHNVKNARYLYTFFFLQRSDNIRLLFFLTHTVTILPQGSFSFSFNTLAVSPGHPARLFIYITYTKIHPYKHAFISDK